VLRGERDVERRGERAVALHRRERQRTSALAVEEVLRVADVGTSARGVRRAREDAVGKRVVEIELRRSDRARRFAP
jgi:hypothetical protein